MATAAVKKPVTVEDVVRPTVSKKVKALVAVLALLLCGGGAAGTYVYLSHRKPGPVDHIVKAPTYVTLEPFTVNLTDEDGTGHMLRIGLILRGQSPEVDKEIAPYLPQLRSRLLIILSTQKSEFILTQSGKAQLLASLLKAVRIPLAVGQKPLDVDQVLLSDFVMQ